MVFNIKGNEYRLIAALAYSTGLVFIKFIGTHKAYGAIDFWRPSARVEGPVRRWPSSVRVSDRSRIGAMKLSHGTVVAGKVVLDEPSLPEGANVYVFAPRAPGPAHLSPDEFAELEAALAEDAAGDSISGEEFLNNLRSPVRR